MPKFLDNIKRYEKAKELGVDFSEVKKNYPDLDKYFTVEGFNHCLTQEGIEKYNLIRGGQSTENKEKIQGINEKINLYVQQIQKKLAKASDEEKADLRQSIKNTRSCKLEELYKQILSDSTSDSFQLDIIENDGDLYNKVQELFTLNDQGEIIYQDKENTTENPNLKKSLDLLKEADPKKLYIKNDRAITDISQYLFSDWGLIQRSLEHYVANKIHPVPKGKKETKTLEEKRKKWLKQSYLSFDDIHQALELYFEQQYTDKELDQENTGQEHKDQQNKSTKEQKAIAINKPLFKYFTDLKMKKKNEGSNMFEETQLLKDIQNRRSEILKLLEKYKNSSDEKIKSDKDAKGAIKEYLESLMDLQRFLKPLFIQIRGNDKDQVDIFEKDDLFYSDFDILFHSISLIVPLLNQTRNYLTKKPYSMEKYKLNFENSTLADGWDQNKEKANTCVLFKKDCQYFLGIMDMNKDSKKIFEGNPPKDGKCYQKMIYKLLPGASKMLPKVFFSQKNINNYAPSKEILDIRNHATHTKSGTPQTDFEKKEFDIQDMYKMIDFYKRSIAKHPDWKDFNFNFSPTKQYKEINDFYREIEYQGYKITCQKISKSYIDQCVQEGKLYLFQIYNKDFSQKKKSNKGKPNLHTMYWKALFDANNLQDVIYKLSGEAELFYRKASIPKKVTHPKGQPIQSKKDQSKQNKFDYDIIKDKRFTENRYFFHVPIECNFKASKVYKFNEKVNQALKKHINNVKIIGIDRGERHLAYYTVIDQKGKIMEQKSLNKPFDDRQDYQKLLHDKEKERDKDRKSWNPIEKIKDLKTGYLSQVIHKISKLMLEHNAIVVFEDLNFEFKRGRFKVEKQVYQKLEKMLIDKLNFLIFKDKQPKELSGYLKALQLTDKFDSFQKMGKQTGFIFYVPAYHTSKICPATGFINLLYPKCETIEKTKEFFGKFDQICFNESADYFEFHFDYKKFNKKAEGLQQEWVVCSHGKRLKSFRDTENNNQWTTREVDITQELKDLLKKHSIEFENEECLIDSIVKQKSEFFKEFIRLLRLTLQMRNSKINTDEDYLISSVKDHQGNFFDSRKPQNHPMPCNADANGAYHIALKGLLMLQQLNKNKDTKKFKPNLSNKAWFEFVKSQAHKK